jgi:hypothetical protein
MRLILLPHHKAPPLVFTDFELRNGRSLTNFSSAA